MDKVCSNILRLALPMRAEELNHVADPKLRYCGGLQLLSQPQELAAHRFSRQNALYSVATLSHSPPAGSKIKKGATIL